MSFEVSFWGDTWSSTNLVYFFCYHWFWHYDQSYPELPIKHYKLPYGTTHCRQSATKAVELDIRRSKRWWKCYVCRREYVWLEKIQTDWFAFGKNRPSRTAPTRRSLGLDWTDLARWGIEDESTLKHANGDFCEKRRGYNFHS